MHRRSGRASGIMPTSGIYAGKTTFASTIPLSFSLSFSLSLPRPLHSSRFSVSSTRTGTVSVHRCALSFPSLFFLPFPPPRPTVVPAVILSIFFLLSLRFDRGTRCTRCTPAASLAFHYNSAPRYASLSRNTYESPRNSTDSDTVFRET